MSMTFAVTLSKLDLAVIAVYFAVTLGAGLFMGRFVKSSKDFFSGGNRVPWWMGAISSYMAMISAFVFIAHGGIAYEEGLVAIVVFWSCAFAILAGTWIFAPRWRRIRVTTPSILNAATGCGCGSCSVGVVSPSACSTTWCGSIRSDSSRVC